MRIRKHLSPLHLPAVRSPLFTRHERQDHALITSPPPPVTPTPAVVPVALQVSVHDPGEAVSKVKSTYRSGAAKLDVAAVVDSGRRSLNNSRLVQEVVKQVTSSTSTSRLLRAAGTGTIVRCFTTPAAMTDSIAHVKRGGVTESHQQKEEEESEGLVPPPPPPRPASLPTRPKRTKPNPFLKSCSRLVGVHPVELVHDCMLQEEAVQLKNHETVKASDVSGGRHGAEDVSAERESGLQLTDSNETDVEQVKIAKRPPRRTASTRSLQMLEELNEDFESNRCRRRDGKGWRCRREAQPDYSLCDYHLDKFRATSQRTRSRAKRKPVKARSLMSI